MTKKLELIFPGEVLLEEFMKPYSISQNKLARDIDVPPSRIHAIIHGQRAITADMALRLAKYFGTTAQMWLNLQNHYDIERVERDTWPKIEPRIRVLEIPEEHAS